MIGHMKTPAPVKLFRMICYITHIFSSHDMSMMQEKVPPFTEEEYTKTFQHLQNNTNNYEIFSRLAGKFIVENGFDKEPIAMLR